jgi:hypothetical protein
MAYNILKGTVEFTGENGSLENTVDLASDQSINGGKTFTQKLTASAIVLAGAPLVHPPITTVNNAASYRVALFDSGNPSNTLSGNVELSFRYGTLTSSYFSGSAIGLTNLQAYQIQGTIQGSQINRGNGLIGGGAVSVQQHDGITVDSNGVSVNLNATGAIEALSDGKLCVNPFLATDITAGGQTLADNDVLLVQDVSKGLRKTTLTYLYSNYISSQLPTPAIQSYTNNSAANRVLVSTATATTVNASSNLTFDGDKLAAIGQISASLGVTGSALHSNTLKTEERAYLSGSVRRGYTYIPDPGLGSQAKYTLSTFDNVVVFNVTGAYTAELPILNSDLDGIQYYIKNIGAGTVSLTGSVADPAQKIDSQNAISLTQGDSIKVMSLYVISGYEWTILSHHNV